MITTAVGTDTTAGMMLNARVLVPWAGMMNGEGTGAMPGLLLDTCTTVWLRASPEEHMRRVIDQGDTRPMRDNKRAMEDLRAILASREALYAKADFTVDTSGRNPQQTLAALLALNGIAAPEGSRS